MAYRLLFVDGHGSHINMRFLNYCDEHRILIALYPPHSTHTLQPLDVCMFRPLSQAYSSQLTQFMDECQGISSITKRDFFPLFWSAWKTAFIEKSILSSFAATGIDPFNPDRIICRFAHKEEERPSSSSSSDSILKPDDWKRIEKLLRSVITDRCDKRVQKLSNTIHGLHMENC